MIGVASVLSSHTPTGSSSVGQTCMRHVLSWADESTHVWLAVIAVNYRTPSGRPTSVTTSSEVHTKAALPSQRAWRIPDIGLATLARF
eukprot:scaffold78061_cov64-Phaeocystis_antarctica.AAC.2